MKIREEVKGQSEKMINIVPFENKGSCEDLKKQLLELQLKMATSSINHEYARIEFNDADDEEKRHELLDYMQACHAQYFEARMELSHYDPYELASFEADLMRQKLMMLGGVLA